MSTELDRMLGDLSVTDKQMEFCEEYLKTLNMSASYRKVYAAEGQPDWRVYGLAKRKLNEKGVREYINARRKEAREELVIDTTRVLSELASMAFTDILDVVDTDSNDLTLKDIEQLTPSQRKAIKKISMKKTDTRHGQNTSVTIEMHDKQRAIDTLCKHLGIIESAKNLTQNNMNIENAVVVNPKDLTEEQLKRLVDAEKCKDKSTGSEV